jgi:hypothetical protein
MPDMPSHSFARFPSSRISAIDRFGGFETTEKDSFDPEFASFNQKWFAKHSRERQRRHLGIGRKNLSKLPKQD